MNGLLRRALAAAAVAGLAGAVVLGAAGAGPALAAPVVAAPSADAATVRLAGAVSPAAPDANTVQDVTIPLTVTNTTSRTLYDLSVSSLRSAPITSRANLATALGGDAVEESDFTKPGPRQPLADPLAPGASTRVDYTVDTSDASTGICLCVLGVYALDVTVRAADTPDGAVATVARTQTYLPSLLDVDQPEGVGWLWPLLDRPHRFAAGSVFTDDDLATSVAAGGRLDRALQVVEDVDAASVGDPAVARSVLLLLDPELLDELVTMTRGYTVTTSGGGSTAGTGGPAAAAWLARLAAVLPRHDVRTTLPSDPDVVGLAARSVTPATDLGDDADARIAAALQLPGGALPAADLAWPVEKDLDASAYRALAASGATGVVTTATPDDAGAVTAVDPEGGSPMAALVADPELTDAVHGATALDEGSPDALQRLVVTAAMTSVTEPDRSRYVAVVPDRDVDVEPADAARAVLATAALGTPVSPVTALVDADRDTPRADLVAAATSTPPDPLATALDAAGDAARGAATVRAAAVGSADGVIGDLAQRVQRATANGWVGHGDAAAPYVADLAATASRFANAVQVVRTSGGYSLASADAPLLLTVANNLSVAVKVRIRVDAVGRSTGFTAAATEMVIPAGTRPTTKVPVSVTRSGRFDVAVTLSTTAGATIGQPTPIVVTSTAVGTVGKIVTYGAGALLVLALLVRGVRRLGGRSGAGSAGTGPDDDPDGPEPTRAEDHPTVPASNP